VRVRRTDEEKRIVSNAASTKWKRENPERVREARKKYWQNHPEELKQKRARSYRRFKSRHPERYRELQNNYRRKNKVRMMMRNAVCVMLNRANVSKQAQSRVYVGCSAGFLRNHLESLFKPGMTWGNAGEWHVDHIIPISLFPFQDDPSLLFVASHWTNLQPLWGKENLSKGPKYPLDESRSA
jgi:5-methylcytosine-specific restriction endonuclease McrA